MYRTIKNSRYIHWHIAIKLEHPLLGLCEVLSKYISIGGALTDLRILQIAGNDAHTYVPSLGLGKRQLSNDTTACTL